MATYVDGLSQLYEDGLVQFWGIDLKGGIEMSMYGTLFESHHAYTLDEAVALLQNLSTECDHRMDSLRGRARELPPTPEYPRIVLLIDEAGHALAGLDPQTWACARHRRRGAQSGSTCRIRPPAGPVPSANRAPAQLRGGSCHVARTGSRRPRCHSMADLTGSTGIRIHLEPDHGDGRLFQGAVVWRRRPDGTGRVGAVRTPPSERCSRRRRGSLYPKFGHRSPAALDY